MKLIGSTTSPYVRKVRLLLSNTEYEFEELKALTPEGAKLLGSYGPIKRIPILKVDQLTIFDSTLICEYLLEKRGIQLSIEEKLNLKLIDELCDSSIMLFQQKIWKIDHQWENTFSKRLYERAFGVLKTLEELQSRRKLTELQEDWLYCVLDWLSFRSVYDWQEAHPALKEFYESSREIEKYQSTRLEQ
ncbi:hypothetical protein A9Q84_17850 [Halobacteriovorax marinus]|uniref:GST N-terminal domain-containing protein n=1 Tax=Halobacteriovorax marinus TaxID=97084 RepID=A0A1Y5F389_9BACT|nr:hypothetical protein A9Q84_17850 [Halobacteriovorax marinus]